MFQSQKPLRIGIIAGEASGDILASGLMRQIKTQYPNAIFEGIGGQRMIKEGFDSFFPMERLSVMGLIEPLKRIFELLRMRKFIVERFINNPPDVFIGVDAPDFNLGIETKLKANGIKTVHYVSPTVWAWRKGRIHKVKKAVSHALLIFPFELKIYQQHQIPATYVGHTLAEEIPLSLDKLPARKQLGLPDSAELIGILPGSRNKEIQYIAEDFIKTSILLYKQDPKRVFIAAMHNNEQKNLFEKILKECGNPVSIIFKVNNTRSVLQAIDAAMVVSGTATLEAALMKRPFIVGYKMGTCGFQIAKRLVKLKNIALINIIAGKNLVTEYIQDNLVPEKMANEINSLLKNDKIKSNMLDSFEQVHLRLRQNADLQSANTIIKLIKE